MASECGDSPAACVFQVHFYSPYRHAALVPGYRQQSCQPLGLSRHARLTPQVSRPTEGSCQLQLHLFQERIPASRHPANGQSSGGHCYHEADLS